MGTTLESWGYGLVETPAVEEYRTLEAGVGTGLEGTAFRLFDLDGTLLALRPEMTVPVARVAATRLAGEAGPLRVRYASKVYREHASLRGQAREFTQVGFELIGAAGPGADAEVVALVADALSVAGLREFTIAMGTVAVLDALLTAAGGQGTWRAAFLEAAHARNLVEIDRLAGREDLSSAVSMALRRVPRLQGGAEVLAECQALLETAGCASALAEISETWDTLGRLGITDVVTLDFGMMRSFGYYTGLVIEALAPGLGLPLGGGGRYDGLLASFGRPAPAAGFALGLERVMIALADQGRTPSARPLDAVCGGTNAAEVLLAAERLRAAGWRVVASPGVTGAALVAAADGAGAEEALVADGERIVRLDRSGEPATPLSDPLPQAPTLTWAREGGGNR
jgi:ATP phosphoribosyltransferase regulatory subunit